MRSSKEKYISRRDRRPRLSAKCNVDGVDKLNEKPTRKNIRLQGYDYSQAGHYFVTICVADKKPILSKIKPNCEKVSDYSRYTVELLPMGVEIEKTIQYINNNYKQVKIEKYAIMPDHLHILINLEGKSDFNMDRQGCLSLRDVVKYLKSYTTREYRKRMGNNKSVLWQQRYYDHIIRNDEDYNEKWQYIDNNPLKYILLSEGQL